jgi:hypothetical protein
MILASLLPHLMQPVSMLGVLLVDAAHILRLLLRSRAALAAENLFLHKQLALYQERNVKPGRATNATRFALVWLARWFDWRQALTIVQPATLTRWVVYPSLRLIRQHEIRVEYPSFTTCGRGFYHGLRSLLEA